MASPRWLALALLVFSLLTGCRTEPDELGGFIILTLSDTSMTVLAGGSDTLTGTVTRHGTAPGVITLTMINLPTGVTAQVSALAPADAATSTATVIIAASANAPPGNYNLTARARSPQLDALAGTRLTVAPAAPTHTIALTAPASTRTRQDGIQSIPIWVVRTNFSGDVELALSSAPAGVTGTFSPTPGSVSRSELMLRVGSSVVPGAYALVVRATGEGVEATAPMALTVDPIATGNVTVDFSACPATSRPFWFAFQDGTGGAWTEVSSLEVRYRFDVIEDKAGIAFRARGNYAQVLEVRYGSRREIQALTTEHLCPPDGGRAAQGKSAIIATRLPAAGYTAVAAIGGGGGSASSSTQTITPAMPLTGIQDGTHDLVGYARRTRLVTGAGRLFIARDINTTAIPEGGTMATMLDFTGPQSIDPATAQVTIANLSPTELLARTMEYQTGSACSVAPLYRETGITGSPFTVYGVPATLQRPTDRHRLRIEAFGTDNTSRSVTESFSDLGPRTFTLPSGLPDFQFSFDATRPRPKVRFTLPPEFQFVWFGFSGTSLSGNSLIVRITATAAGYLGGAVASLEMPDFSGTTGWASAEWRMSPELEGWEMTATGRQATGPCGETRTVTSTRYGVD